MTQEGAPDDQRTAKEDPLASLRSRDPSLRRQAAMRLAGDPGPRGPIREALLRGLEDPEISVGVACAAALAEREFLRLDTSVERELRGVLLRGIEQVDPEVRASSVQCMALHFHDEESLAVIRSCLESRNATFQRIALRSLGNWKVRQIGPAVSELLGIVRNEDADLQLREDAAILLAWAAPAVKESAPLLRAMLANSEGPRQISAAESLLHLRQPQEVEAALRIITGAIASFDPEVRSRAIGYLAALGPKMASSRLQALLPCPDLATRVQAAAHLAAFDPPAPGILEILLEGLRSSDLAARTHAVNGLHRLEGEASGVLPEVIEALRTGGSVELRCAACKTLASLLESDPAILPSMVAALGDPAEEVRFEAVQTVLGAGMPEGGALQRLIVLLLDDEQGPWLRGAILDALTELEEPPREVQEALDSLGEEKIEAIERGAEAYWDHLGLR